MSDSYLDDEDESGYSPAYRLLYGCALVSSPVVFLGAAVAWPVAAGWTYAAAVWEPLRSVADADQAARVERHADAGEDPVYVPYLRCQFWSDLRGAIVTGLSATVDRYRHLRAAIRPTLRGRGSAIKASAPWYSALIVGVFLSSALALLAAATVLLIGLIAILVTGAALALAGALLGATDHVFRTVNGIFIECPSGTCNRRIRLPVYRCDCGATHTQLVSNRNGVFWHICFCGRSLPTAIVLGRYRLPAQCPREECKMPLPSRTGRIRLASIPLIGASAAGKSTLLHLFTDDLVRSGTGKVSVESTTGEHRMEIGRSDLATGTKIAPTQTAAPNALVLDIQNIGGHDLIIHFYDPRGEVYATKEGSQLQGYLRKSQSIVIVVDPFLLPNFYEALSKEQRTVIEKLEPSIAQQSPERDPTMVIEQLLRLLHQFRGRRKVARVLVVATKADLLAKIGLGPGHGIGLGPGHGDALRDWLSAPGRGLGNGLRALADSAKEIRYVASDIGKQQEEEKEQRSATPLVVPLRWLAGIDPTRNVTQRRRRRPNSMRRQRAIDLVHDDEYPRRYRRARLNVASWQMILAVTGAAALPVFIAFQFLEHV